MGVAPEWAQRGQGYRPTWTLDPLEALAIEVHAALLLIERFGAVCDEPIPSRFRTLGAAFCKRGVDQYVYRVV